MLTDPKKKAEVTPEIQGQVLKSARESLRFSVADLAKKACLSKKHITELEEGGFSSFFSPEHKVRVAKKVSLLLGLKENQALVFPGGDLAKQESLHFDAEVVNFNAKETQTDGKDKPHVTEAIVFQETKQQPLKQADAESAPETTPQGLRKSNQAKVISDTKRIVSLESLGTGYEPKKSSPKNILKPALSILLILLIGGGLYLTKDHIIELINPKPIAPVATDELLPLASEEKPNGGPVIVPATQPALPTPQPVAPNLPTSSIPSLPSEASCPKSDATINAQTVFEPTKPGNFVFIQSKIKQTVCVADVGGKVTVISLDAGGSHTFTGKAPFTILSSGLSNLVMFFQGRPVRISNEQARSIRLEEGKLVSQN